MDEQAATPVIATKLLAPRAPPQCLPRPRLLDAIDRGVGRPVTLLSAPAGAGKTALLSSWIAERAAPGPVCWLTVDREDAAPARFWSALLAALREPVTDNVPEAAALAALRSPVDTLDERFLPELANALAALGAPLVLVLDDLHEIVATPVVDQLSWLLQHAPAQLRAVLATRTDPALRLARTRVHGELTELRAAELAFTLEETRALYGELHVELGEPDLAALWRRTEGWAAGLRLAALSLCDCEDPARFVADFAHGDRAVADFLATEVLDRQPPDVLDFMLRTCLVDDLGPQLADALVGKTDSAAVLARLERENAFLHALDASAQTYRYHQMFRDLLRARLHHTRPAEAVELHRRAAAWHAVHDEPLPALRHALEAGAWDQASQLATENWLALVMSGRSATLHELLGRVPPAVAQADAELAAMTADSRLEAGDLTGADELIAAAEQHAADVPATRRERFAGVLSAAKLHRARLRGDLPHTVGATRELLARTDDGDASAGQVRCVALAHLGAAELWWEDATHAREHLEQALALADAHGAVQVQLDCLGQLAVAEAMQGRLTRSSAFSREALALAATRSSESRPATACAQLAAGVVALLAAETNAAMLALERAAVAARSAEPPVQLAVALAQSLALASGGPDAARRGRLKLLAAKQLAQHAQVPASLLAALESCEARALIAAGEPAAARSTLASAFGDDPWPAHAQLVRARLELHAGEPRAALAALDLALADAIHPALRVEALVLRALAQHAAHEHDAAHDAFEQSLACAETEPFRAAFLDGGPAVRELLALHARGGTAYPDMLAELLDGAARASEGPAPALAEALTERERAVLRLLPTQLTHAEIAGELFVSVNTVKTHVRGIYRKLDVARRADAVDRARGLQLLSSHARVALTQRALTPPG
ncbi:MAG: LuxR C-terminal-related transcriptional regulator [Conexibacter sp.]